MVPPPPPPHHLYAKANTSSSIFLHWRRPAFTTAQIINYTIRCNPVGLQNASLVLYLQTYVASYHLGPDWASAMSICLRTYLTYKMCGDLPYSVLKVLFLTFNSQFPSINVFFFVLFPQLHIIRLGKKLFFTLKWLKKSMLKERTKDHF